MRTVAVLAALAARSALAAAALLAGCSGADEPAATLDDASVRDGDDAAGDAQPPADAAPDSSSAVDAPDADTPDTKAPDATAPDAASDALASTACRDALAAEGVAFEPTSARGVVDAVKLKGTLHGVLFASGTATTTMTDPVACAFAHTLLRFADLLKAHGYVRVGTLGSYCYRCCCAWSATNFCRGLTDPEPSCGTSGYSNHSWGRAIDVRYLYRADGTRRDVNDPAQWVQYATTETCTKGIAAQSGTSLELYQLACDATAQKVFGTVLTPNYNAAHRDHLHMDIGQTGTPTSWTTKLFAEQPGVDLPGSDDACGG